MGEEETDREEKKGEEETREEEMETWTSKFSLVKKLQRRHKMEDQHSMFRQEDGNVSVASSEDVSSSSTAGLFGRVDIYGQHKVGKETLISHILSKSSDVLLDDLGYFNVSLKNDVLQLKNMDQHLNKVRALHYTQYGFRISYLLSFQSPKDPNDKVSAIQDPDVCVVMFSLLDRTSFLYAKRKVQDLKRCCNENVSIFLVGNKSDAIQNRRVTRTEAFHVARIFGCRYLETSVISHREARFVLRELMALIPLQSRKSTTIFGSIQKCVFKRFFASTS
ncbi:GTP-binding protein GEM-like [Saccostrea cucullata]|uniref:GTP-binding protein GEM-like n=1 Tax=Saccostrea cuccullata TaxID=36930 RepID=UPI002ED13025